MAPSYSWMCLTLLLSLLASSTPQFNSFPSRTRFQPAISPRFSLNSFGRQRGLNSFGRGVFTTTVDHPVTQTIPTSTLEPDTTKSTRRSTTTASPVTPASSSTAAGAPGYSEPSSRGSSIVGGLGNSFTTAKTRVTTVPEKIFTTTTEAVTTTVTVTRTTSPTSSSSTASLRTSARVTTPGVLTNLFGRFNVITTRVPVHIAIVDGTTTVTTPPPSTSAKFSNLFSRTQSSSHHLLPHTTTRPTVQPLKLVTTQHVGGIHSSSTKPVLVTTTRPSTTVGSVTSSRSLFGVLGRLSTETPETLSSTESSVTAKTSSRGSSIFSRLARPQATTGEAVSTTGATTTTTSVTTSASVSTTDVLTNLLGRFNIFSRTTKAVADLTTAAPPLAPPGKATNLFGRSQSAALTQLGGGVGTGRRGEREKDAGLSESKSEGTLPVIEPSEEMMDKVVDLMESLILAGSDPASTKQSRAGSFSPSSVSDSASQPGEEEVPRGQAKFSLFGNRREKNKEGDKVAKTGKKGGGGEALAEEEKYEAEAGEEKKVGFGKVKESRNIGNLLTRLNLTGRKQFKVARKTSENMSDDELDEGNSDGETSDEIMDIVLESMEKLFLNQNQAGAMDRNILTREQLSTPAGPATSSGPNSHRKPNSSFFSRNALKTRLRPLVAAALSSPQSSTPLEDKVSMLRAVLSEELPPHIRDHILSSQFTQHARTLFRHQQTLSEPAVTSPVSSATSQDTRARTTTNQETIALTQATTTVEATTVTEVITTTVTTVTSQAASRLKTTPVPSRRVQAVPDQISKQPLNEELHAVASPPRRIKKLFSPTGSVTAVDSPQSSVQVLAATEPGSGISLSENSREPLPRRIVLVKADSVAKPPTEGSRRTTTQPSVKSAKQKAVKLLQQLVTTTKQPGTTSDKTMATDLPTRRVVQTETGTPFTTPSKQKLSTPASPSKSDFKQLKSPFTQPPAEMNSSVSASFSSSNDEKAALPPLVESESRRIVLPVPSTISTSSVITSTTTVSTTFLPTESLSSKLRPQPVVSLPRRIVLLKALTDLVKSDQSPAVVGKNPSRKNKTKSLGFSGLIALPKLDSLANAKSSESSSSTTQPRVKSAKQKAVKLLQQLVTTTKQPGTTSDKTPTRRVVQTETSTPFTTPSKQKLSTPASSNKSDFKQLKSPSTLAPTEMSSSVNASFSPSNNEKALLESESRRIVLLESLASRILPKLVPITVSTSSVLTTSTTVSTTTVLPTESGTSKPRSQQPVESSPRRIVLLRALSDLVKSEQSPAVVNKSPTKKNNTKSPGLSGVTAKRLVLLANAKSSESSSTLLGQTTSSFTKITKESSRADVVEVSPIVSDSNQRSDKSLQRRIVLLKALSEDLITTEGRKDIIQKKLKALHKPGSVSEKDSSSKSIQEDAPSTNTPRRPIKLTPTVLPNLMPKAFKIHPAVPTLSTPSTVTTEQATKLSLKPSPPATTTQPILATSKSILRRVLVSETTSPTRLPVTKTTTPLHTSPTPLPISDTAELSTPTLRLKSTEDPTQSLTTRSPAQVVTPSILLARRLPSGEGMGQEVLKTVSESSSPAKEVIEIVDVGVVETKVKASAPKGEKTFFSRTPYHEVASFHSLGEGGVELVTVGGRTLARSSSGGRIPVRDSLPAGLTRTLKVTPVFITTVGRGRFF